MARLIMPRTRAESHAAAPHEYPPDNSAAIALHHQHSERVLLLEDEEQTNLVLKEYLQSLGYNVVAVGNGVDGLREVMKSDFELVICDMMMPRLPGDMFYIAVRKTRPQLCKRFVFITGHQESSTIGSFIAESGAAVLVKPFRLQQLQLTLEAILSKFAHRPQPTAQAAASLPVEPLRVLRIPENLASPVPDQAARNPAAQKREALPSMVRKALKVVGFLRGAESAPAPRSTRRILQSPQSGSSPGVKSTRRINLPPTGPQATPGESIKPQVTRRMPVKSADTPKTTIRVPAQTAKTTIRLPQTAKTTIRLPDSTSMTALRPAAQASRTTPRPPADLPKPAFPSLAKTPKTTIRIPRTSQPIAGKTTDGAKTTIRLPKDAAKSPTPVKPPTPAKTQPAISLKPSSQTASKGKVTIRLKPGTKSARSAKVVTPKAAPIRRVAKAKSQAASKK